MSGSQRIHRLSPALLLAAVPVAAFVPFQGHHGPTLHRGAASLRHHQGVHVVTTRLSAALTNLSPGALGGTEQQVAVTLTPSHASAAYAVGTVTIGESPKACNPAATEPLTAGAKPGTATLGPAEVAVSYSPPCGATITIAYSGGTYRAGGRTYELAPDTWTVSPNQAPGTVDRAQG